jgi:hypothetical protein
MRNGMAWLVCVLVFAVGGLATWSLTRGEGPADVPAVPPPPDPASATPPPAAPSSKSDPAPLVPAKSDTPAPSGDFPLRPQIENSMRSGAEWLFRMNTVKGRFYPGWLPSVGRIMESNDYLCQAGAALALARAARAVRDKDVAERYAGRATQAVLALLDDTDTSKDGNTVLRHLRLPTSINRLAAAGLLVAAIHELPSPQKDLLDRSDELCAFLRKNQREDGSLSWTEGDEKVAADAEGNNLYPGIALYGLMRSQAHRPASWKSEVGRKALAYYAPWWRTHRTMNFVPWQTAAYTEAFLLTKEKPFADFVFEMNDWLCDMRYENIQKIDPSHFEWLGGFMSWADGKVLATAPDISSALYVESVAEACRAAREATDLSRHKRYSGALESSLQYVMTLQYTEANTQHFSAGYRETRLLGGFHNSHQDGDLRTDATQHAVCAMIQYLACVAR